MRRAAHLPGDRGPRGHIKIGTATLTCALGGAGIVRGKREGDKGTPAAAMRLIEGFYRADRLPRPSCRLPLRALPADLGWCDAPESPLYNRPQRLPLASGHEVMRRDDGLYDVLFVLDWNVAPRRKGRGSAIFFHCARSGFEPTLGCVAIAAADMRRLVPRLSRHVRMIVT